MNKIFKISLSVFAGLLIILIYNCAFGFLIGGQKGWLFYILSILVSLLMSSAALVFVNGKDYFTVDHKSVIIGLAIPIFIVMVWLYNPLNMVSRSNEYVEYKTEIIYVYQYKSLVSESIEFQNREGQPVEAFHISDPYFKDEDPFLEGKTIRVREYEGGFGFPSYEIFPEDSSD